MRADGGGAFARRLANAAAFLGLVLALLLGCRTRGGEVLSVIPASGGAGGSGSDGGLGGAVVVPDAGGADESADTAGSGGAGGSLTAAVYISPDGSDGNPGTEAAPWRTFAHALPTLQPGSTLVLLDGTYTSSTTGLLRVFCGSNAVNGTPDRPITVRALNERRAFLAGNGSGIPLELSGCANWVVDGLHAEDVDTPNEMGDEPGSVVVITRCTNVLVRRVLAAHPNRYFYASVYVIAMASPNVVVEECEALDFHYYGYHAYDSQQVTFRRDYAHSRDTPDIAGGPPTLFTTLGDGGFLFTKTSNGIMENCVAEDVGNGFTLRANHVAVGGRVPPQRDQLLGDIANGVSHAGFELDSYCANSRPCTQTDQIVRDAVFMNDVSRGGAFGFSFQGGINLAISNASVFDTTDTGVFLGLSAENAGLLASATAGASIVTSPAGTFGFHSVGQFSWGVSWSNVFGPTQPFVPSDSHVTTPSEIDPQLGGCLVYVPDSSPLKTLGEPGAGGLGANIVFQTVGGQVTTTKLWDQTTGQFPCGAVVMGLNDATLADVSCMGLGARMHVGAPGCPIP
ncbi:MAG TPA: hypothetical protein VMT47_05965 [Polyangia bacterium]|nr:hypothetical protein [Polyangia bacterium]